MLESPDMVPRTAADFQLYLASNSPRRKELLSLVGLEYGLLSVQVDETPFPNEDGIDYVKRVAQSKAAAAADQVDANGVIIAADTAVIDHYGRERPEILGKPADQNEALYMLRSLRGHSHQVFTAISILDTRSGTILSDLCTTHVPMRNYSDEEMQSYVTSGDPMDKAGAYAIQHAGFHPVDRLRGCFANVMGLPLCHLVRSLHQLGITPQEDITQACQATLGYDCPVSRLILQGETPVSILS